MRIPSAPALVAGLLCCSAAAAQTFSGLGPAPAMVLPTAPVPPAAERPAPVEPSLRRLNSVAAPLRVWGENGEITWTLAVTEREARAGGRFQVGYLAAVSVLPEASTLTLSVNGAALATTAIDGAKGLRTLTVDIPPGAMSQGFNAVRVSVAQRHRVDCSVAATYELWTQIDPESTGFLSSADGFSDVADLAAVRPAADGSTPIRLLAGADRLSERRVERLLGALQEAVLAGRFPQPSVEFAPLAGAGDGLAIAVGTADQLAKTLDLAAFGPVSEPRLALLPATAERRPVLVATGAGEADVTEALARLSRLRAAPPAGTPAGLRALAEAGGRRIAGGESLTLADLGFADAHVTARTHRIVFDLALPFDILPADYDRLVLDLDASYAAGLAPGAQISVDINGETAASAPLARAGGESFRRRATFLPLRLLRPGLNRITLTAELPRADDAACPSEATAPTERLTLLASTRLTIPPLARIARQPDLAETLSADFPYAEGGRGPTLSVPAPEADTMAAAATFAARLGLAAGRPIPFAFAAGRKDIAGPVILVSPARRLDAATVATAGLQPQAVRDAWAGREASAGGQKTSSAARRIALRRDTIASCRARPEIVPAPVPADAEAGPDLGGASAVLTQAVTGPASDDLLTLVTAPSSAGLREAVDCLVHPRVWSRPQGRMAVLAADGAIASWPAEALRYVHTAPPSMMNLRRIAAGWFSLHAGLYGLFALLIAGGLAGSTQLLVRNLGRRSK